MPSSARSRWRQAGRPGCHTVSRPPHAPWQPAGQRSGKKAEKEEERSRAPSRGRGGGSAGGDSKEAEVGLNFDLTHGAP